MRLQITIRQRGEGYCYTVVDFQQIFWVLLKKIDNIFFEHVKNVNLVQNHLKQYFLVYILKFYLNYNTTMDVYKYQIEINKLPEIMDGIEVVEEDSLFD